MLRTPPTPGRRTWVRAVSHTSAWTQPMHVPWLSCVASLKTRFASSARRPRANSRKLRRSRPRPRYHRRFAPESHRCATAEVVPLVLLQSLERFAARFRLLIRGGVRPKPHRVANQYWANDWLIKYYRHCFHHLLTLLVNYSAGGSKGPFSLPPMYTSNYSAGGSKGPARPLGGVRGKEAWGASRDRPSPSPRRRRRCKRKET